MKMMFSNKLQRFMVFTSLLTVGSIFASCSKGENSEQLVDSQTSLSFAVENVGEVADAGVVKGNETAPADKPDFEGVLKSETNTPRNLVKKSLGAINTSFVPESATFVSEPQMLSDDGYEAIVTLTEESASFSVAHSHALDGKINAIARTAQASAGTKAVAMDSGNKYRVLIYDNNDNYVGTIDATSGTALSPAFPVFKNTTYKWYAYSYNSQTQVPVPTNTASPTITTTAGAAGLLYDSGSLTTVEGANKISITFEHKLASIAVKVDTRGLFTTINAVSGTNNVASQLRSGTLNLKTGNYTATTANSAKSDLLSWTNAAAATGDSVKVAYLYTSGTTAIIDLEIALTSLKVKLDNNTIREFKDKVFKFSQSFTPQLGKRYTATITLIESPITVAGTRWARENLYYRAADNGYRFRNQSSNIYQTNTYTEDLTGTTEFFNFGALTSANNSKTMVRDICKFAFPYNTWRLPTNDEFIALAKVTNSTGSPRRVFGQSSDARYAAWTYDTSTEYGTSWTSFMGLGRRNMGSNTIQLYSTTSTSYGYFWSATYSRDWRGNPTDDAYYMRVKIDGTTGNSYSGSEVVANLDADMRYGMNIRCVRND